MTFTCFDQVHRGTFSLEDVVAALQLSSTGKASDVRNAAIRFKGMEFRSWNTAADHPTEVEVTM